MMLNKSKTILKFYLGRMINLESGIRKDII